MKKRVSVLLVLTTLLCLLAGCDSADYKKADEAFVAGNYQEAAAMFEALGDYEDSVARAVESKYLYAEDLLEAGAYADAIAAYEALSGYKDAAEKIEEAKTLLMYETYADVFAALTQGVWFYEATSVNAVNVISFTQEEAKIKQIYYDGNGPHTTAENACAYVVDGENVTVTLADKSELQIAYTMDGGAVTLAEGYFTAEQVEEGLQGYWGLKDISYNAITGFVTSEYIYNFEDGKVTFESATLAYGSRSQYYYYGPYEGTYKVTENGLEVEARNEWQFGFIISEGKVAMCRCGKKLTTYEGFKGKNGFSF